jgi:hypothetical protein
MRGFDNIQSWLATHTIMYTLVHHTRKRWQIEKDFEVSKKIHDPCPRFGLLSSQIKHNSTDHHHHQQQQQQQCHQRAQLLTAWPERP